MTQSEVVNDTRKAILTRPQKLVAEYDEYVRYELGIYGNEPWRYVQFSNSLRQSFKENVGLWRVHYMTSLALNVGLSEKNIASTFAYLVQIQKAVHQAALDAGRWRSGACPKSSRRSQPTTRPWRT